MDSVRMTCQIHKARSFNLPEDKHVGFYLTNKGFFFFSLSLVVKKLRISFYGEMQE